MIYILLLFRGLWLFISLFTAIKYLNMISESIQKQHNRHWLQSTINLCSWQLHNFILSIGIFNLCNRQLHNCPTSQAVSNDSMFTVAIALVRCQLMMESTYANCFSISSERNEVICVVLPSIYHFKQSAKIIFFQIYPENHSSEVLSAGFFINSGADSSFSSLTYLASRQRRNPPKEFFKSGRRLPRHDTRHEVLGNCHAPPRMQYIWPSLPKLALRSLSK